MKPNAPGLRAVAALLLIVVSGAAAAQSIEGRWALASAACSGEHFTRPETPLILETMAIRWFSFDCKVVSSYKVGAAWFLQGQCVSEGRTATIPIMLEPRDGRLRVGWNREPVRDMQRCHWTGALGYHWAAPEAVIQEPSVRESR
jgi:hypothetical protein